jgi:predicted metal-dependent HD superfamily phosphohydrolase
MDDLAARWRAAARGAGARAPDTDLDAAGADLLTRWAQRQRRYHTVVHLRAVLAVIDANTQYAADPDVVRVAAWWHDAVYDPHAIGDTNERDSAELAGAVLAGIGVPPPTVDEVARLVLLTAGHMVQGGDPNGALLCDADLAVLASPPSAYDEYAAAVRQEYAHVPDPAFRAGRAAVLRRLLHLPSLYRLPALRAAWEPAARANLERELMALLGGGAARRR